MAMRGLSMRQWATRATVLRPKCRFFSAEPAAAAQEAAPWVPPPHPATFRSPKVEELYFKLIDLPKEEIQLVSKIALKRIDVDIDKELEERAEWLASGGAASMAAAVEEAPVEVKTHFDLKLLGFDAKSKIKVIKEVRAISGLGLKEAKDLVEGAPKVIKKGLKQEEAEELMAKLVEIGAVIELA
jgi:large subunit ribosomal protein L7/L12